MPHKHSSLSNSTDHYSLSSISCNLLMSLSCLHPPGQWAHHTWAQPLQWNTQTHRHTHMYTCMNACIHYSSAPRIYSKGTLKSVVSSCPLALLPFFHMFFLLHLTVTLVTQSGALVMHGSHVYVRIIHSPYKAKNCPSLKVVLGSRFPKEALHCVYIYHK